MSTCTSVVLIKRLRAVKAEEGKKKGDSCSCHTLFRRGGGHAVVLSVLDMEVPLLTKTSHSVGT